MLSARGAVVRFSSRAGGVEDELAGGFHGLVEERQGLLLLECGPPRLVGRERLEEFLHAVGVRGRRDRQGPRWRARGAASRPRAPEVVEVEPVVGGVPSAALQAPCVFLHARAHRRIALGAARASRLEKSASGSKRIS
jgi:hypothetical protein